MDDARVTGGRRRRMAPAALVAVGVGVVTALVVAGGARGAATGAGSAAGAVGSAAGSGAAAGAAPAGTPASWRALPRAAAAATRAMPGGARAQAWGDPAAGCYLVEVAAPGAPGEDAAAARGELAGALGLGPATAGHVDGALHEGALTGSVRGWVVAAGDRVVSSAAACVYNDREPAACAAACAAIWSHLSSAPELP
jgi:hypothetical protein